MGLNVLASVPSNHVHESDIAWDEEEREGGMDFRQKRLAGAAGAEELGVSLYEIEPEGTAWPYHYHYANEEGLFVLDGTITVRDPDGTYEVDAGGYVAFRTGEEGAHELINETDETVRLLLVATMEHPDVEVFPESDTIGLMVGGAPGEAVEFAKYFRDDDAYPFWEEEVGLSEE